MSSNWQGFRDVSDLGSLSSDMCAVSIGEFDWVQMDPFQGGHHTSPEEFVQLVSQLKNIIATEGSEGTFQRYSRGEWKGFK